MTGPVAVTGLEPTPDGWPRLELLCGCTAVLVLTFRVRDAAGGDLPVSRARTQEVAVTCPDCQASYWLTAGPVTVEVP